MIRFRKNDIVDFLLKQGLFDLIQISQMNFSQEDYTQLMQLIGYSVNGYGTLNTSPSDLIEEVDCISENLYNKMEGKLKNAL